MLIRRGKDEGWLHLDLDGLLKWATASGITFIDAAPAHIPERGIGLVATHDLAPEDGSKSRRLLEVSQDLILNLDAVKQHASFDRDFREVLESIGDFGRTPRGAILSFLLFQASVSCPHLSERIGVHTPFTDYVKTLPCERLPTFWTAEEQERLVGTTLAPAITSKLKSLQREWDLLCAEASSTRWYRIVAAHVSFDDWLQVDAMFRSRALDFDGSCMIPGVDLASHAAGTRTNAYYDKGDGLYTLQLLKGQKAGKGEEITITYGDEKGACEMLFSYGFIEDQMDTAETLFLSLAIPEGDPYRAAKLQTADCAPGFKIIDMSIENETDDQQDQQMERSDASNPAGPSEEEVDWKGDFIWLCCVGHEDGLRFELARTIHGEEELQATFNGQELKEGASGLRRVLAQTEMWPVYRLRAIVILQQRVFDQLQVLYSSQEECETLPEADADSGRTHQLTMRLRELEFALLEKSYECFEKQKAELAQNTVVQDFLAAMNAEQPSEAQPS